MTVRIITDSAADLPKHVIEEYGIDVLPLMVYLGEEEFRDGQTLDSKELFDGMRSGRVYKTGQVTLNTFREAFIGYAERGESCIYVAFSSGLSGTYQSAVLVRNQILEDYPAFDMEIIDTKCASMGFGLVVCKAARMARAGHTKDDIVQAVAHHAEHMEHIFTVDELDYLYRGGRVSRTAAFIGGLLNIKPILHVEDGKLVPLEKIRGRRKVLDRMAAIMEERGTDLANQLIGISHGDDLDSATALQSLITERFGCSRFMISMIGGSVGAHAGPGTLALFFLNEQDPYME